MLFHANGSKVKPKQEAINMSANFICVKGHALLEIELTDWTKKKLFSFAITEGQLDTWKREFGTFKVEMEKLREENVPNG
jgi:hypothetical protein